MPPVICIPSAAFFHQHQSYSLRIQFVCHAEQSYGNRTRKFVINTEQRVHKTR